MSVISASVIWLGRRVFPLRPAVAALAPIDAVSFSFLFIVASDIAVYIDELMKKQSFRKSIRVITTSVISLGSPLLAFSYFKPLRAGTAIYLTLINLVSLKICLYIKNSEWIKGT